MSTDTCIGYRSHWKDQGVFSQHCGFYQSVATAPLSFHCDLYAMQISIDMSQDVIIPRESKYLQHLVRKNKYNFLMGS